MATEQNKRTEITESELFEEYMRGEWYEAVTFADYTQAQEEHGIKVIYE